MLLSVWGEPIVGLSVGPYKGIWYPQWLKRVPRHRNDLSVWRGTLVSPDMCLFGLSSANTNCIGSDLPGKWPVLILAIYSCQNWRSVQDQLLPGGANASKLIPEKLQWISSFVGGQNIYIPKSRSPVLPIFVFRALFLKNQTPITLPILGVRG